MAINPSRIVEKFRKGHVPTPEDVYIARRMGLLNVRGGWVKAFGSDGAYALVSSITVADSAGRRIRPISRVRYSVYTE